MAAATARRCAAAGQRTLVLSTDPAHSLADAVQVPLGAQAVQVGEHLWAQQVSAQAELERHWGSVRSWLGGLLVERGVERITAGELTVPPGLDELFSLLVIRDHHEAAEWDVLVVDCAPTGETLRLLAFPDVSRWWLERIFPQQGRIMDAARPLARAVLDVSLPGEDVLDEIGALARGLIRLNEILRDGETCSVRLVTTPDRMVIDESRRTFTYLNLYGFLTDAVVVNRVFPAEVDGYFGSWRERQQEHLVLVEEGFAPVPVLRAPYFEEEVVGGRMLDRLGAALFASHEPAGVLHAHVSQRLTLGRDGAELRLELPFASREDIDLKKVGSELVVSVDGHRRTLLLPPVLADHRATGARFEDGALLVTFAP